MSINRDSYFEPRMNQQYSMIPKSSNPAIQLIIIVYSLSNALLKIIILLFIHEQIAITIGEYIIDIYSHIHILHITTYILYYVVHKYLFSM